MHELGLVVYVMEQVEKIVEENELNEVASITLELGEVSSVLPDYFTDCWDYSHKKHDLFKDTELKLEMIPGESVCEECEKTYSTIDYKKQCPHCGSYFTHLLRGDEFNIKEIEAC